jgi:hypothetical protein
MRFSPSFSRNFHGLQGIFQSAIVCHPNHQPNLRVFLPLRATGD